MLFADRLVVLRGGGDLATGVASRLHHAGFPVVVLELDRPLTVRRTVAVSSALIEGRMNIEDLDARRVDSAAEARVLASTGAIPVLVSPKLAPIEAAVIVDARMAKGPNDTAMTDAPLVIGLGPGFAAGVNCHAAIETKRGHRLGRVIWDGPTAPNTGVPGTVGGRSGERVLRSPASGTVWWDVAIADIVTAGQVIGRVGDAAISAPIGGVVRGLLTPGLSAATGAKIGDIDPRGDPAACFEISDKSLAIGGGVVEAVLTWLNR